MSLKKLVLLLSSCVFAAVAGNQAFAMDQDLIEDEIILTSATPTITKTYPISYGGKMKNGHAFGQTDMERGVKHHIVEIDQVRNNLSLTLTYSIPVRSETPTKAELLPFMKATVHPQLQNVNEISDQMYLRSLEIYKRTFNIPNGIQGTTNYNYMVQGLGEVDGQPRMCYHTFLKVKVTVEDK